MSGSRGRDPDNRTRLGPQSLSFPVDLEGQRSERTFPFIIGVLGDFSGQPAGSLPPLSERKFIQVDRDNFDGVLAAFSPVLNFTVENFLRRDGGLMTIGLGFQKLGDFEPARIVEQVKPLKKLLEARNQMGMGAAAAAPSEEAGAPTSLLDRILEETDSASGVRRDPESARSGAADASTIDRLLSRQLAAILHAKEFQRLESCWLGLRHLVFSSATGPQLKIKILNVSKHELFRDFENAGAPDRSSIFKKVYEDEFCLPAASAEPFGILIGGYEFINHPEDLELLAGMAQVAASSFCPFISSAGPGFFGLEDYSGLCGSDNLVRIFDTAPYTRWKSFRASEESRFVALVLPRALARLPYGKETRPVQGFDFEEILPREKTWKELQPQLAWMNTAYILGAKIAESFDKWGWASYWRSRSSNWPASSSPSLRMME
ncbi:MAG: type VI secretion system contractile sheath small subunit [Planctomycetes bacterium]|nr:type VI secretion system contractile sheath small subunit [Planctomycetota bacterium]